jgi:hypothetical protein
MGGAAPGSSARELLGSDDGLLAGSFGGGEDGAQLEGGGCADRRSDPLSFPPVDPAAGFGPEGGPIDGDQPDDDCPDDDDGFHMTSICTAESGLNGPDKVVTVGGPRV